MINVRAPIIIHKNPIINIMKFKVIQINKTSSSGIFFATVIEKITKIENKKKAKIENKNERTEGCNLKFLSRFIYVTNPLFFQV